MASLFDITKWVAGETVRLTANTDRAKAWMQQRVGSHTITLRTDVPDQRQRAISVETEALALRPPLTIETL
jgi:hypothetical protein